MKVLDLDMDFFLTDACPLAPLGERPPESCARPYGDEQVIAFLEEQCGLSRAHPVPGRIFDTHDKALDFWLAQMEAGKLQPPFDVVHVDTHSDLAFGPPGTDFVLKAVLTRNPGRARRLGHTARGKARRSELPAVCAGFPLDQPPGVCAQSEIASGYSARLLDAEGNIRLQSDISVLMEAMNGREPTISFEVFDDYRQFRETGYEFVTMAQSPRYAPASADRTRGCSNPISSKPDG
ncbi:MAG: hypothetical protein ACLVJB_06165 [Christensenellales bacterium]